MVDTNEDGRIIDVPSFAWVLDKQIELGGFGRITVDVSFGGNFFVIIDSNQLNIKSIDPEHTDELIRLGIVPKLYDFPEGGQKRQ